MEWTASDGRKGRLTGAGKRRLTAANLAQVPSEKRLVADALNTKGERKSITTKPFSNLGDLFVVGDGAVDHENNKSSNDTWTDEQDKKLMGMKTAGINMSWAEIAEKVGKSKAQCGVRFNQIKSKDSKSKAANENRGGDGGSTKSKTKSNKQNQNKNSKSESKKDEPSGGDPTNPWDNGVDGGWGCATGDAGAGTGEGDAWDIFGDTIEATGDDNNGGNNSGTTGDANGGSDMKNNVWKNTTNGHNGTNATGWDQAMATDNSGGNAWDDTPGGAGAASNRDGQNAVGGGWNTDNNQTNNNIGNTVNTWETPAPANPTYKPKSKTPTMKATSQHNYLLNAQPISNSNPARADMVAPLSIEVTPDKTFSADDLRLIARILQRDCSSVWDRVSWAFGDKTGRRLNADEFERKITGRVEGKGSKKGC